MNEAWELVRGNIEKAQNSHDQRSKPLNLKLVIE